mmetsp:Transcript_60386/g.167194  ORF Transcript_60386/g.167194 Transcript_60386/m.167194 type:complete len:233 (-) Transcript_60386:213-911(-)
MAGRRKPIKAKSPMARCTAEAACCTCTSLKHARANVALPSGRSPFGPGDGPHVCAGDPHEHVEDFMMTGCESGQRHSLHVQLRMTVGSEASAVQTSGAVGCPNRAPPWCSDWSAMLRKAAPTGVPLTVDMMQPAGARHVLIDCRVATSILKAPQAAAHALRSSMAVPCGHVPREDVSEGCASTSAVRGRGTQQTLACTKESTVKLRKTSMTESLIQRWPLDDKGLSSIMPKK